MTSAPVERPGFFVLTTSSIQPRHLVHVRDLLKAALVMQPFPPESDLKIFEGDSIAQIRLDPYGVQFAFESGRLIVAERRIEQIEPDEGKQSYDCVSKDGPPLLLHRLLYRRIEAIRCADLSLTFEIEGGSSLTVFSELGQYESGNISGPDFPFTIF